MTSLWLMAPHALAAGTVVTLTADDTFEPSTIEVGVGEAVTFRWDGGFHNVVFDDGTRSGDPTEQAGLEWSRTFTAPGLYPYLCEVHTSVGMIGSVTVSEAGDNGGNAGGGDNNAGNGDNGDNADSGNNAGSGENQGSSSYPSTGPESGLIPDIGLLLLAGGGTGYLIEKRRRARRRS
jgi:plastocyanin